MATVPLLAHEVWTKLSKMLPFALLKMPSFANSIFMKNFRLVSAENAFSRMFCPKKMVSGLAHRLVRHRQTVGGAKKSIWSAQANKMLNKTCIQHRHVRWLATTRPIHFFPRSLVCHFSDSLITKSRVRRGNQVSDRVSEKSREKKNETKSKGKVNRKPLSISPLIIGFLNAESLAVLCGVRVPCFDLDRAHIRYDIFQSVNSHGVTLLLTSFRSGQKGCVAATHAGQHIALMMVSGWRATKVINAIIVLRYTHTHTHRTANSERRATILGRIHTQLTFIKIHQGLRLNCN